MKGHLQRMVASVAQREPAVHPLVGGIYVKEPRGGLEESAIESVKSRRIDPLSSTEVKRSTATGEMRKAGERPAVVREPLLMESKSGFQTDAELPSPDTSNRAQSTPVDREGVSSRPTNATELELRVPPEDLAAVETEAIRLMKVRTLLPKEEPPERWGQAKEQSQSAVARMAEQPARRDDEGVQIHIGRIEVIAMPPATQRAAPAARKTESLDEYLRRKDRRLR